MAKNGTATLNGKTGVCRTVGGRRIFIAKGQSLEDAMKASGKFGSKKKDNSSIDDRIAELKKKRDAETWNSPTARDAQKEIDKLEKQKAAISDSEGKTIQMKDGDKTEYKVLDEATDSMGEKIYKVMEDGQEKWVQGDLFDEKPSKTSGKGAIKEKYGLKDERNELYTKEFLDGDMDADEFRSVMQRGGESSDTINNIISGRDNEKAAANKSVKSLNEIDRIAGGDESLERKGRELGLQEFKQYMVKEELGNAKNIEKIQSTADKLGLLPHEVQDMAGIKDNEIDYTKGRTLKDQYRTAQGVSDDWFTQNARELGISDDEIAREVYSRKGIATSSSDDNIKRLVAKQEREKWEAQQQKNKNMLTDKTISSDMKSFINSEIKNNQDMIDRYKQYEKTFESRIPSSFSDLKMMFRDQGYSPRTAASLARDYMRNRKN